MGAYLIAAYPIATRSPPCHDLWRQLHSEPDRVERSDALCDLFFDL